METIQVVSESKKNAWKRAWIPLIGWILAGGFFNNLVIHSFLDITLIDWRGMTSAVAVMITISAGRDVFMKRSSDKHLKNSTNKGWKRNWIPIIGYVIAAGFAVNCLLAPYIGLIPNSWPELIIALTTLLGVSGIRDVAITPKLSQLAQMDLDDSDENDVNQTPESAPEKSSPTPEA